MNVTHEQLVASGELHSDLTQREVGDMAQHDSGHDLAEVRVRVSGHVQCE